MNGGSRKNVLCAWYGKDILLTKTPNWVYFKRVETPRRDNNQTPNQPIIPSVELYRWQWSLAFLSSAQSHPVHAILSRRICWCQPSSTNLLDSNRRLRWRWGICGIPQTYRIESERPAFSWPQIHWHWFSWSARPFLVPLSFEIRILPRTQAIQLLVNYKITLAFRHYKGSPIANWQCFCTTVFNTPLLSGLPSAKPRLKVLELNKKRQYLVPVITVLHRVKHRSVLLLWSCQLFLKRSFRTIFKTSAIQEDF